MWSNGSKETQRHTIHETKPWSNSTGPKSEEGKQRSSRNADKGKSDLRSLQKMISKIHRERLELLRLIKKLYGLKINI